MYKKNFFSWNWFIWFHKFSWPGLFKIFWPVVFWDFVDCSEEVVFSLETVLILSLPEHKYLDEFEIMAVGDRTNTKAGLDLVTIIILPKLKADMWIFRQQWLWKFYNYFVPSLQYMTFPKQQNVNIELTNWEGQQ